MCRIWKMITCLEFLSQGEWFDIDLKKTFKHFLFFDPHYNPMGSFSNPYISKCSMMTKWHQLVPISGDVGESDKVKKLQLYAFSRCTSVSTWLYLHVKCMAHQCNMTLNVGTFNSRYVKYLMVSCKFVCLKSRHVK